MSGEGEDPVDVQPGPGGDVSELARVFREYAGAKVATVDLDQNLHTLEQRTQVCGDRACALGGVDTYCQCDIFQEGPKPSTLGLVDPHRIANEEVIETGGGEDLGLRDGGDGETPGASSDLEAGDLWAFMGFRVRAQTYAGGLGVLGHRRDVAVHHVVVDDQRGGVYFKGRGVGGGAHLVSISHAVRMSDTPAVEAVDLVKRFGDNTAVDGVSFVVPEGTVLGLLGPNGAGKTTTVRMLTTLSVPTSGTGRVAGHDIINEPDAVRRNMGLTGQAATVDELLTARENLRLIGRLYGLPRKYIREATESLLERFSLADAGNRTAKTYSGGMRRRLDLAVSLIAAPPVLFLDEPTTGLDPRSRSEVWEVLRGLVRDGTTLLLTTQYLEEADQLADDIVVIDKGKVIAAGTPTQLKDQAGAASVVVTVTHAADFGRAEELIRGCSPEVYVEEANRRLTAHATGLGDMTRIGTVFAESGIAVDDLGLKRPSLDDVFLHLTGHRAEPAAEPENESEPEEVSA